MNRVSCHRFLRSLFSGLIILDFSFGTCPTAGAQFMRGSYRCRQEDSDQVTSPDLPSGPITIADEPKAIDPIPFIPIEVTKNATVDFDNEPLHSVVDWIRREYSMEIVLDRTALREESIAIDVPITDHLKNEPLFLLLNRLDVFRLDWYVEDHVLHITTETVADRVFFPKAYYVGDLLKMDCSCQSLLQTITRTINDHWSTSHGDASTILLGDVLMVRAKQRTHQEINGLLAAIRKPSRRTFIGGPIQNEATRQKLDEPVSITFDSVPLSDAVRQLGQLTGTDIRVDNVSLQEEEISDQKSVSISCINRPLRQVLHVMLSNLHLAFLVDKGVLWITTQTTAANSRHWKLAVFDVRDLCRDQDESEELIDAIKHQTSSGWESQEGETGDIVNPLSGILVVRYTDVILNEISDFLKEYRKALESSPPPLKRRYDPTEQQTRYYRMQTDVATDLQRHLPELVQPSSWKSSSNPGAQGTILLMTCSPDSRRVPSGNRSSEKQKEADQLTVPMSVLVIQQTRKNHREIQRTIDRISRGDPSEQQQRMGIGGGFF